jgi:hypothetical protein
VSMFLVFGVEVKRPNEKLTEVQATDAGFDIWYNVIDHIIYSDFSLSAKGANAGIIQRQNTLKATEEVKVPPPIEYWSDVVFLEWNNQAGNQPENLEYIWRVNVENSDTKAIVEYVLNKRHRPPWIREFLPDEEVGSAIIGSPNGIGVTYFLINHKSKMGRKRVSKIYVYDVPDTDEPTHEPPEADVEGQPWGSHPTPHNMGGISLGGMQIVFEIGKVPESDISG